MLHHSRRAISSAWSIRGVNVSEAVQRAVTEGRPVVALESTIISHGMPYPRNLEVAQAVEEQVRKLGALPATVGIIRGKGPVVGLNKAELIELAKSEGVLKVSRRDLAYASSGNFNGATTVAATSYLASLAGIRVFATGGLGGVHRGAEISMDISADLYELSRSNMTVVCSGIKSILDIPRTLEVLESLGVPVYTFRSNEFPAFFTNSSGITTIPRLNSAEEVSIIMSTADNLKMSNGLILAVPNPSPTDDEHIQRAIDEALSLAAMKQIAGSLITPFLLSHIQQLTAGASLDSNVELILNNAKVATEIAVSYSSIKPFPSGHQNSVQFTSAITSSSSSNIFKDFSSSRVLCVGGAVVDMIGRPGLQSVVGGKSVPGHVGVSYGGVARNIAEALARLGDSVALATVVGLDANGTGIVEHGRLAGIDMSLVRQIKGQDTASYLAVQNTSGDVVAGIADTAILDKSLDEVYVDSLALYISAAAVVVCDANVSPRVLKRLVKLCTASKCRLVFDCTSDSKSSVIIKAGCLGAVSILKVNQTELRILVAALFGAVEDDRSTDVSIIHACNIVSAMWELSCSREALVVVTLGEKGAFLVGSPEVLGAKAKRSVDGEVAFLFRAAEPINPESLVSASGAGDCFTAGFVTGLHLYSGDYDNILRRGLSAAKDCLTSIHAVPFVFRDF